MRIVPISADETESGQSGRAASVTYIGHATSLLELGGTVALADPVLGGWVGPRPLDLALLPVWGWDPTLGPKHFSQPPLAFQRLAAALAPGVEVRILEPGRSLSFSDGGEG